jgi:hypothetical protein
LGVRRRGAVSPWSPYPLLTRFFARRGLSAACDRPTSSIDVKRPLSVRLAYALAVPRRTRSRLPVDRDRDGDCDRDRFVLPVRVFFLAT